MPKVSIIMPVYNAEKGLKRCIDSILAQEFSDFELIAVDDGSRDGSGSILDAYAVKDRRVHPVHQTNGGVSNARNHGISLAKGDFLQFVDSDDYLPVDSTKTLVRVAEEHDADLVVAAFYRVVGTYLSVKYDIDSTDVMTQKEYASYLMNKPADFYYGVLWNKLYRRSIIRKQKLVMDEQLNWCEDTVFNLEYLLHCQRIAATPVPVYYYVKNEGSLVASAAGDMKTVRQMKERIVEYYDSFYQNLYDVDNTIGERLNHVRFMFAFATDDLANGKGRTRVGKEKDVDVVNTSLVDNMATMMYYMDEVYDQQLRTVATVSGLAVDDVKVLNALMFHGKAMALGEIADFTHQGTTGCVASVEKLALKGLAKVDYLGKNIPVSLTPEAEPVLKQLGFALKDFENICFKGFDEEHRRDVMSSVHEINSNLKQMLRAVQTEPELPKKDKTKKAAEGKESRKKTAEEKELDR